MKEGQRSQARRRSTVEGPSIQVICLGDGGGPSEDNATGLLVRSTSARWSKGSILAVDAGSHLAAITRIFQKHFPLVAPKSKHPRVAEKSSSEAGDSERSTSPEESGRILQTGPFAGLTCTANSARANAVHLVREHVSTYLLTHAHLDHISAFAINTAALQNTSKPKKLAALPFTVNAIKEHIFNDVIWPNLTDEEGGVGLVTYQRLAEGGNLALGEGQSRGYIEVCEDLAVRGFRISHGECASKSMVPEQVRRGSVQAQIMEQGYHSHVPHTPGPARTPLSGDSIGRRTSSFATSQPSTPTVYAPQSSTSTSDPLCRVVDSSAFFIRSEPSGKEILVFGDVEPDSLSSIPRNYIVWTEAASKIVSGSLGGIFIECSYSDSQPDRLLFGHLVPRHLINELSMLAELVIEKRAEAPPANTTASGLGTKRKPPPMSEAMLNAGKKRSLTRSQNHAMHATPVRSEAGVTEHQRGGSGGHARSGDGPATTAAAVAAAAGTTTSVEPTSPTTPLSLPSRPSLSPRMPDAGPLVGLRVVVIHVKDSMQDGDLVGDVILAELKAHEACLRAQGLGLGCDFELSKSGESYWF